MQKLVWQNANGVELDLTSGNYGITEWEGFSNAPLNVQTQTVPFQDGAVFLDALVEPRELNVTLAMQDNNNLELRYQQRREIIAALNPKLGEGYLIYTNDFISKRIKCVPQIPLFETHNSDTAGTPKASLSWTACNPYWEDMEETVVDFSNGDIKTIQNEGDVKIGIELEGNLSNNNMVFRNITTEEFIKFREMTSGKYYISTMMGNKIAEKIKPELNFLMNVCNDACIGRDGDIVLLTQQGFVIIKDFTYIENKKPANMPYLGDIPKIEYCSKNDTYYIGTTGGLYSTQDFSIVTKLLDTSTNEVGKTNYYKDKYIAIGYLANVYISTDGINFSVTDDIHMTQTKLVYSSEKNLFIIVGGHYDGGGDYTACIKKSSDGITWTEQTLSFTSYLYDIIYNPLLELFIAVGTHGVIITSPDGTNWTQRTSGIDTALEGIAYNDNYTIACGSAGSVISTDGVNWELLNERFDFIFYNGWFVGVDTSCGTKYSLNGFDYVAIIEKGGATRTQNINDLKVFGNKMMCYGQWYNSIRLLITENGWQTWISKQVETYNTSSIRYTYAQNKNLYVYIANTKICTSSDLENWAVYDAGELLADITYSEEKELFVVVGVAHIFTSSNGTDWTASVTQESSQGASITYSNYYHKFYLVVGSYLYSSENGTQWEVLKNDLTFVQRWKIKAKDNIVAMTNVTETQNAIYVIYTRNGTDWHTLKTPSTESPRDLCILNNLIYLVIYTHNKIFIIKDAQDYWMSDEYSFNTYFLSIENWQGKLYYSGLSFIAKDAEGKKENCIDKLTTDSNMNLGLKQGANKLMFENINGNIILKYRQKYIGV